MDQIENIFIQSEGDTLDPIGLNQFNRVKMGEVFQLHNERYALVCIHCSEEFQYFSEFTLHVQEHFQNVILGTEEKTPTGEPVNESVQKSPSIASEAIEVKVEPALMEISDAADEYNSDGGCNDFIGANSSDNSSEVESKTPNKQNTMEIQNNAMKVGEMSNSQPKTTKKDTKRTKSLSKCEEKIQKPRKVITFKRKACASEYKRLVADFESSASHPANKRAFDVFKYEVTSSIFPSNIRDTIEIRMLAKYVLRGYTFEEKDGKMMCPVCDAGYKDSDTVRRHILTHVSEPVFECGLCSAPFRAPRYLRNHLNKEHLSESHVFECVYCHETFKHHRQLVSHMLIHSSGHLNCVMCDKKFKMQSSYQLHMVKIHGNDAAPIKSETSTTANANTIPFNYREKPLISSFECYMCQKNFRERRQLRNHMKIHVQQPRLCLLCGILCSGSTSMNRHMKLHYPDETKSHICTICGKGFKIRQYMLRHRRKEHQVWADNQYPTCQVCGAKFDKKSLLHEHMKTHPFEETRNFICTICNHAARNSYNLRRHMLTHNQERSFECNICHKTFRDVYAKDHMKTHEDIRKHKCTVCSKKFKRAYALKQHMYQHGGAPEHNCDICGKGFSRTDKLLRHRRRHGIPLNYHCRICSKGFISQKSFELHEMGHLKMKKQELS